MSSILPFRLHLLALAAVVAVASGCSVSPTYERPSAAAGATLPAYKEAAGWLPAAPADALTRGPWWSLFNDAPLNDLMTSIDVSNQTVAASVAAYDQARALVREQRAALFPTADASLSSTRTGGQSRGTTSNAHALSLGGSWEPDIWGKLRASVNNADAAAQASAADLAGARLSAQGELATDYFSLRVTDALLALTASTIAGYERALKITQDRYSASIGLKSDLLQAQNTLATARISQLTLVRQRATYEHAIALLVGKTPAEFSLPVVAWNVTVPAVPLGLPSELLQRRPDIAGAERRVAAANEAIGIARAAYYPSISLTGSYGTSSSSFGDLLNASSSLWSFGLSASQTLFNAGATTAAVDAAKASYAESVANYRQAVLTAFGAVEDQLAAMHAQQQQEALYQTASTAADEVEAQLLNRYRAGQVSYSDVVTAQATALSARSSLVQAQADRQTTAVALIQALGGGWSADTIRTQ